jgi:hypothetical protein
MTESIKNLQRLRGDFDIEFKDKRGHVSRSISISEKINQEIKRTRENISTTQKEAMKIMGKGYFGRREVKEAFSNIVEIPETLPPIPFSKEELARARNMGGFLIYRAGRMQNGGALTAKRLAEGLHNKVSPFLGCDKILFDLESYCNEIPNFSAEAVEAGWALVNTLDSSRLVGRNYFEQTEILLDRLENQIYFGMKMPDKYEEAISEYAKFLEEHPELTNEKREEPGWADRLAAVVKEVISLKANQLFRPNLAEAIYDMVVLKKLRGARIYSEYGLIKTVGSEEDDVVVLGSQNASGAAIGSQYIGSYSNHRNLVISRRE